MKADIDQKGPIIGDFQRYRVVKKNNESSWNNGKVNSNWSFSRRVISNRSF